MCVCHLWLDVLLTSWFSLCTDTSLETFIFDDTGVIKPTTGRSGSYNKEWGRWELMVSFLPTISFSLLFSPVSSPVLYDRVLPFTIHIDHYFTIEQSHMDTMNLAWLWYEWLLTFGWLELSYSAYGLLVHNTRTSPSYQEPSSQQLSLTQSNVSLCAAVLAIRAATTCIQLYTKLALLWPTTRSVSPRSICSITA